MVKAVKFASPFAFLYDAPENEASSSPKEKEADVNVICLQLGEITRQTSAPITGDPVFCSNADCKAIFNSASKLDSDEHTWTCEFCKHATTVELDEAEMPKSQELDYILEPIANTTVSDDNSMIIFCIDTSGSMCVTSEIEVHGSSKQQETKPEVAKFVERGVSQRLPNQRKNVQYISRLQSVQAAVTTQIEALHKNAPKRRLGLVTFNDDIVVIGDGTKAPITVAGDKLDNYEELVEIGNKYELDHGVEKSRDTLLKQVKNLEEQGGTALGPALLLSVAIASKKAGSKIIICTDGQANIGLGAVDEDNSTAGQFYDQVAALAKKSGVTVSVFTIAGNECRLENIGKVADITGGEVDIVDPTKISSGFAAILEKPVIATNVSVTLVTHPAIRFSNRKPVIKNDVGNILADSEITFDYSVVPDQATGLTSVPFQVQIGYRRPDGPLCVTVITTNQPLTSDRALAEKDVDVGVIGVHVSKKSASLVQDGKYEAARANALSNRRMLERAVHTDEQKLMMDQYDATLSTAEGELAHTVEREERLGLHVDDESMLDDVDEMRSRTRGDRTAAYMYQMKGSKSAGCVVQ